MHSSKMWRLFIIFMFIGNLGIFIPHLPIYINWIVFLCIPLLFFYVASNYRNTDNKSNFFIPLIVANVAMSVIIGVQIYFNPFNLHMDIDSIFNSNVPGTLVATFCIVWLIEKYKTDRTLFKIVFLIIFTSQFIIIPLVMYSASLGIFAPINRVLEFLLVVLMTVSLWGNMGGLFFITMGLILYFAMENKKLLAGLYTGFCLFYFLVLQFEIFPRLILRMISMFSGSPNALNAHVFLIVVVENLVGVTSRVANIPLMPLSLWFDNYSWMMIFSLLFILMYKHHIEKIHVSDFT